MLSKYYISLFLTLLLNNANGLFRDDMPSSWKADINKMISDKLEMELNQIRENIEKRFEKISVVRLEEHLGNKLESKLEENLGDKLEAKLGMKLEEDLGAKLETKLEKNLGEKLEEDLGNILEAKLEENLGKKLEEKLEENLGKKLEDSLGLKLEVSLGEKLEPKLENNIETTLEEKLKVHFGTNLRTNLENNIKKKFKAFEKRLHYLQTEEWVLTSLENATSLSNRAVIGGYEPDGSPLWIARSPIDNNTFVPGKLNVKVPYAKFALKSTEYFLKNGSETIKVLCAPPEKVRWVECRNGVVPPNAIVVDKNSVGEKLYVGRAREQGSLTPGQVNPTDKVLYISFNGKVIKHDIYEVLCLV